MKRKNVYKSLTITLLACISTQAFAIRQTLSLGLPLVYASVSNNSQQFTTVSATGAVIDYRFSFSETFSFTSLYEFNASKNGLLFHGPSLLGGYSIFGHSPIHVREGTLYLDATYPVEIQVLAGVIMRTYDFQELSKEAVLSKEQKYLTTGSLFGYTYGISAAREVWENIDFYGRFLYANVSFPDTPSAKVLYITTSFGLSMRL